MFTWTMALCLSLESEQDFSQWLELKLERELCSILQDSKNLDFADHPIRNLCARCKHNLMVHILL